MSEQTVGQRLKILISELHLDVRSFCKSLDVSETTVRNYFNRGTNPNAEFLTKLTNAFRQVNLSWLLTGNSEMFLSEEASSNSTVTTAHKNKGNIQSNAGSHNVITNNVKLDNCQRDLATAQKEIALLTSQLADKERTIQILLKQNA